MNEDIARERIETALRDYKQEFGSFFIAKMLGLGISYSEESCSIQIPVENCPINLRHWFKNNDALVKVEKDYRETYVLQEEAYKRWMTEKDPLAAREAEKSWNRYREQLQVLNEQLEKAEQKQ